LPRAPQSVAFIDICRGILIGTGALMISGSCLCGGVKFHIKGALNGIQICHCQQCRKAQGGAFAANIPVDAENFAILTGSELLSEFESTTRPGKYRVFCRQCGSPIISRIDSVPDVVRVRAGAIDKPLSNEVTHHQFVANKVHWFEESADAPVYDEFPPK